MSSNLATFLRFQITENFDVLNFQIMKIAHLKIIMFDINLKNFRLQENEICRTQENASIYINILIEPVWC